MASKRSKRNRPSPRTIARRERDQNLVSEPKSPVTTLSKRAKLHRRLSMANQTQQIAQIAINSAREATDGFTAAVDANDHEAMGSAIEGLQSAIALMRVARKPVAAAAKREARKAERAAAQAQG